MSKEQKTKTSIWTKIFIVLGVIIFLVMFLNTYLLLAKVNDLESKIDNLPNSTYFENVAKYEDTKNISNQLDSLTKYIERNL